MLEVQKYLSTKTLSDLEAEFGISAKRHEIHPNLVQLCYDQIESSKVKTHPIVVECRGLILDETDNWKVIAYPFNRFFNYGELSVENFDWTSMRVQEKVDGSLMFLYYYKGIWYVATKGSPTAGGNVGDEEFTFAQLFWNVFVLGDPFLTKLNRNFTYMFELTSKYNRIVTNQVDNEGHLTLLGARDLSTGYREIPAAWLTSVGFDVVQEFPLSMVEEIKAAAENIDPVTQEGFVLVDSNFNRIKVKSPKYVLIHHLKDVLNFKGLVELIQKGESSELFAYFPDLKEKYEFAQKTFDRIADDIDQAYASIPAWLESGPRKDIALYILANVKKELQPAMFSRLDKKVSSGLDWLVKSPVAKIAEMVENYVLD